MSTGRKHWRSTSHETIQRTRGAHRLNRWFWTVLVALLTGAFLWIVIVGMQSEPQLPTRLVIFSVDRYEHEFLPEVPYASATRQAFEQVRAAWASNAANTLSVQFGREAHKKSFDHLDEFDPQKHGSLIAYIRLYGFDHQSAPYLAPSDFKLDASDWLPLKAGVLQHFQQCLNRPDQPERGAQDGPRANVCLVVIDYGQLSFDPRLGVMENDFAGCVERLLQQEIPETNLFVLLSHGRGERSEISHHRQDAVFGAAVAEALSNPAACQSDTQSEELSILELYQHVVRRCRSETGNAQTPVLLRGGQGAVSDRNGDVVSMAPPPPLLSGIRWDPEQPETTNENAPQQAPAANGQAARLLRRPASTDRRRLTDTLRNAHPQTIATLSPSGPFPARWLWFRDQHTPDQPFADHMPENLVAQNPTTINEPPAAAGGAAVQTESKTPSGESPSSNGGQPERVPVETDAASPSASQNPPTPIPAEQKSSSPPDADEQSLDPVVASLRRIWERYDRIVRREAGIDYSPIDFSPLAWRNLSDRLCRTEFHLWNTRRPSEESAAATAPGLLRDLQELEDGLERIERVLRGEEVSTSLGRNDPADIVVNDWQEFRRGNKESLDAEFAKRPFNDLNPATPDYRDAWRRCNDVQFQIPEYVRLSAGSGSNIAEDVDEIIQLADSIRGRLQDAVRSPENDRPAELAALVRRLREQSDRLRGRIDRAAFDLDQNLDGGARGIGPLDRHRAAALLSTTRLDGPRRVSLVKSLMDARGKAARRPGERISQDSASVKKLVAHMLHIDAVNDDSSPLLARASQFESEFVTAFFVDVRDMDEWVKKVQSRRFPGLRLPDPLRIQSLAVSFDETGVRLFDSSGRPTSAEVGTTIQDQADEVWLSFDPSRIQVFRNERAILPDERFLPEAGEKLTIRAVGGEAATSDVLSTRLTVHVTGPNGASATDELTVQLPIREGVVLRTQRTNPAAPHPVERLIPLYPNRKTDVAFGLSNLAPRPMDVVVRLFAIDDSLTPQERSQLQDRIRQALAEADLAAQQRLLKTENLLAIAAVHLDSQQQNVAVAFTKPAAAAPAEPTGPDGKPVAAGPNEVSPAAETAAAPDVSNGLLFVIHETSQPPDGRLPLSAVVEILPFSHWHPKDYIRPQPKTSSDRVEFGFESTLPVPSPVTLVVRPERDAAGALIQRGGRFDDEKGRSVFAVVDDPRSVTLFELTVDGYPRAFTYGLQSSSTPDTALALVDLTGQSGDGEHVRLLSVQATTAAGAELRYVGVPGGSTWVSEVDGVSSLAPTAVFPGPIDELQIALELDAPHLRFTESQRLEIRLQDRNVAEPLKSQVWDLHSEYPDRQQTVTLSPIAPGMPLQFECRVGDWTHRMLNLSGLKNLSLDLQAELILRAGSRSTQAADRRQIIIDSEPPKLNVGPASPIREDRTGEYIVTVDDLSGASQVSVSVLDSTATPRTDRPLVGQFLSRDPESRDRQGVRETWSVSINPAELKLTPGEYLLQVEAVDRVGLTTRSRPQSLLIQKLPPAVAQTPPEKDGKEDPQPAPPTKGTIKGVVVKNRRELRRARVDVEIVGLGKEFSKRISADGTFEFKDVPLGTYVLKAQGTFGNQAVAGEVPSVVPVAPGEKEQKVTISVEPPAPAKTDAK
ncbi:MAG: hypothetical protein KF861_05635 [Planctomycetaceae bacterium]|nr:hypothetical protein [Planctomycetaceae bacterium]